MWKSLYLFIYQYDLVLIECNFQFVSLVKFVSSVRIIKACFGSVKCHLDNILALVFLNFIAAESDFFAMPLHHTYQPF